MWSDYHLFMKLEKRKWLKKRKQLTTTELTSLTASIRSPGCSEPGRCQILSITTGCMYPASLRIKPVQCPSRIHVMSSSLGKRCLSHTIEPTQSSSGRTGSSLSGNIGRLVAQVSLDFLSPPCELGYLGMLSLRWRVKFLTGEWVPNCLSIDAKYQSIWEVLESPTTVFGSISVRIKAVLREHAWCWKIEVRG